MDLISKYLDGTRYFGIWYNGKNGSRYGLQLPVKSRDETVELIKKYNGVENCGISVSTFKDGVPYLLYLSNDFDDKDLRLPFVEAKRLYNFLAKLGFSTSLDFSGSKGFHVIVEVKPNIYTKNQLRSIFYYFRDLLNLTTLDTNTFDFRRLMRIPWTYHENGQLCRTLVSHSGDSLDINKFLKEIGKFEIIKQYEKLAKNERFITVHDYPCIDKFIRDREYWQKHHPRAKFEPTPIIRFSWVIRNIEKGKSNSEILSEARQFGWDDFDENKTLYNIDYIRKKNYIHPSCATLRLLGYCLDDCPYKKEFVINRRKYR